MKGEGQSEKHAKNKQKKCSTLCASSRAKNYFRVLSFTFLVILSPLSSKSSPWGLTVTVVAKAVSHIGPHSKIALLARPQNQLTQVPMLSSCRILIGSKSCEVKQMCRLLFFFLLFLAGVKSTLCMVLI